MRKWKGEDLIDLYSLKSFVNQTYTVKYLKNVITFEVCKMRLLLHRSTIDKSICVLKLYTLLDLNIQNFLRLIGSDINKNVASSIPNISR